MKKNRIWVILWLCFCLMMTGCVGKVVSQGEPAESAAPEALPEEQDPALKTGLCLMTSTEKSRSAGEENGTAAADVIMVAVTVDENDRIHGCRIDSVSAEMTVSAEGEVLSQGGEIRSKNELGEEYGMEKASSIGKEWHEQIRALEEYAEGMTLGELRGIRLTEAGKAAEADLAAGVTIAIGDFLEGIHRAAENAVSVGAQRGDDLRVCAVTETSAEDGTVELLCTAAAITLHDGIITGCRIDEVQAAVDFDEKGQIRGELSAEIPSKNQLGDAYGMKKASSIGREWHEQVRAFCAYLAGKTPAEAAGIAIGEDGRAADEELAAEATLRIGNFLKVIEKAASDHGT